MRQGSCRLCAAWVALALTPTGIMLSVVAMLVVASLLEVPVVALDEDGLIDGRHVMGTSDAVVVFGTGSVFAFGPPAFALVRSIQGQREGLPHAGLAMALSALALGLALALPFIWNPVMATPPHP